MAKKPTKAQAMRIEIRDCYTASVDSHVADGATREAAHQSAWRNLLDTFPKVSTGDLASAVDDLV